MSHLEAAATANFVTHATWVCARTRGATVETGGALTVVDSGLDSDTFNIVCAARLRDEDVGGAARRVVGKFAGVARPFSWWVAPGDEPHDLRDRLEACGLTASESELAMWCPLPLPSGEPGPAATRVEIVPVRNAADLATFARINAENWDPPDPNVESFYERSAAAILGTASPFRMSIARLEGRPVAAVEVTVDRGVAGVYNLTTRVASRGKGIATVLLEAALDAAAAEGAHTAVLQAAPAGVGLYRRLGFQPFGEIREFKLADL